MAWIVLNCDCGEGIADDAAILPWVSAANIACGGHAGDAETMRATLRLCRDQGISAGAHPSFPDRDHFGRRVLPLSLAEVQRSVTEQMLTLRALAEAEGARLTHVKPHGALYNHAAAHRPFADAIAAAIREVDASLALIGLAGSALIAAAQARGIPALAEAFADRTYQPDGSLLPRHLPNAVLEDAQQVIDQALAIARHRRWHAWNAAGVCWGSLPRMSTGCISAQAVAG